MEGIHRSRVSVLITGIFFVFLAAAAAAVVIVVVSVVVNGSETAMALVFVLADLFISIRSVVVALDR